ncbi:Cyclic di-GMP phosphodiesterase response regulator RpfG [Posidoniimonas corsicana]|uniref:Cyclic di-GMP phosphodiesterase response regulator RpfG n=1 Tax=Posidoniimonas corsicana TaxID=1938618 RepID=A0A5C5V099_9BACT|nr:HD domain-containing phosphohydrolase [Posidoniimonas corsicana]TWT31197.1 Cyclic di-GMP phosphodiesterase response regulator RpfG [Posidoniimonas corsicana]
MSQQTTDLNTDFVSPIAVGFSPTAKRTVKMSGLVAALSYSLDITEGQPPGHAARTCLIGMRLAELIGLPEADRSDLFYALLLKDLGCSSNASKMCYLFGADDRTVKRDLKSVDWPKMSESFKFLTKQVAPGGSPVQRALKIAAVMLQGPKGAQQLVETRCERGADIARSMGFSEGVALAILHLDEHWDGQGHPQGRQGLEISPLARIAGLAQTYEVFLSQLGRDAADSMAVARRGGWFEPALVDALTGLAADDRLWIELASATPDEAVAVYEPADRVMMIDEAGIDRVAEGFARVVDAKSPWTFRHSDEVAKIAVGMGEQLGFTAVELRALRRMALLHDLGKLGVSNAVLDKPGKPTDDEFRQLQQHPRFTHDILARAGCFQDLAHVAAAHHEKLDGRGYHRGIPAGELPIGARMLCVADMYEAMTASRPYRDGMPQEKVLGILDAEAGTQVCADSVASLKSWLESNQLESRVEDQMQAIEQLMVELA